MNYIIDNPKGIDHTIQKIQTYLFDNLSWGDIDVYGRVYKNPSESKGIMLEAYIANNEYKDVFTDDSNSANIFFIEDDVHTSNEGIKFSNKLKIVFMVNLKKAYPSITHRADMEAEMDAIKLIRKKAGFSFERIEKGIRQSLGDFYTESIKLNDMQPYHIFAITGEITYQVSCISNSGKRNFIRENVTPNPDNGDPNTGGGDVVIPPICNKPAIIRFPDNQFTNVIFLTAGQTKTWQIEASENPTSYGVRIPFTQGPMAGLTVDTQNGLVTFTPETASDTAYMFIFQANNACGQSESGNFIKIVSSDVSTLQPPFNPQASDFRVSPSISFVYQCEILPYMGGNITNYEIWLKGPSTGNEYMLWKNFSGALLGNALGVSGDRIDSIVPGVYSIKSRLKEQNGNYTEFNQELTVTV